MNTNIKVGDKVLGKYRNITYTGVVVKIGKNEYGDDPIYMWIDRNEGEQTWQCKKRKDGNWACACGMDDGKYMLKLIKSLGKKQLNKRYQTLCK